MDKRPFRTFSVQPRPRAGALMAVLKAYMDESGKDNDPGTPIVAVGGLAGPVQAWENFEESWSDCLDKWEIPHLHMKEIENDGETPFKRFREDRALLSAMLIDFVRAIGSSGLFPVAHIVVKDHVRQFNKEASLCINCYSLALYGCLLEFGIKYDGEPIEIVVDKFDNSRQLIDMARGYCLSDKYYENELDWMREATITPLNKKESFRSVLPIQAADFIVWELRRHAWNMRDFGPSK